MRQPLSSPLNQRSLLSTYEELKLGVNTAPNAEKARLLSTYEELKLFEKLKVIAGQFVFTIYL